MPLGTMHVDVGRLARSGGDWSLRRDEGGTWRLDIAFAAARRARGLIGERVRVEGRRIDFDVLAVERIEEAFPERG